MSIKTHRRSISTVSTVVTDLGFAGERRQEPNGKVYRLVKAGGTIPVNTLCTISAYTAASSATGGPQITVIAGTPATQQAAGMQTNATSVLVNEWFWMQVSGVSTGIAGAAIASIGLPLQLDVTGGTGRMIGYVAAAVTAPVGYNLTTAAGAASTFDLFLTLE